MTDQGVSKSEYIEALLANEALYELGRLIPTTDPTLGGAPRHYPGWAVFMFGALITVYRSARAAEAELAHPWLWQRLRDLTRDRFPDDPSQWLRAAPMRRRHYAYARNRYLSGDDSWATIREKFTELAASQARELGLFDPRGAGSFNKPELSRTLYADGKCITPLYKGRDGTTVLDKATGELRQPRFDPDARYMTAGGKGRVYGSKFVLVAARTQERHGRIVFDVDHSAGNLEASVALECLDRIVPHLPGAQAFLYDGAWRGKHLDVTMTKHGLVPIAPVIAKKAADVDGNGRVERRAWVEDVIAAGGDGRVLRLHADAGALGGIEFNERGDEVFVAFRRRRVYRRQKRGGFRFYGEYAVPEDFGGGIVTIRHDTSDVDGSRGFNRSENLRVIPPSDPGYRRLYPRRSDIESINRGLEDSMFLGRAHSVGRERQRLDVLGYALVINSLAMFRGRRSGVLKQPAA